MSGFVFPASAGVRVLEIIVATATTTSTWRNERTATTRKNACNRETMMKIRAVITFIIAQVALAREHASRRSTDTANTADRDM